MAKLRASQEDGRGERMEGRKAFPYVTLSQSLLNNVIYLDKQTFSKGYQVQCNPTMGNLPLVRNLARTA